MDKKEAYRKKWEDQIEHLGTLIDELKVKAKQASTDAREEIAERLEGLEEYREKAKVKLAEIREAGEDIWEDVEEEAEEVFGKLKSGLDRLMSRFGKEEETVEPAKDAQKGEGSSEP